MHDSDYGSDFGHLQTSGLLLEANASPPDTDESASAPRRFRWDVLGGIVVAIGLIALCNPFIGGESNHVVSDNALTSTSYLQINYGSKKIFATAGQTLSLSCDATIDRGYLTIHVFRDGILPRRPGESLLRTIKINHTAKEAAYEVPMPETGLYRIDISPWRERGEYDIAYDISWRVH
jgi:hypothetical protein